MSDAWDEGLAELAPKRPLTIDESCRLLECLDLIDHTIRLIDRDARRNAYIRRYFDMPPNREKVSV